MKKRLPIQPISPTTLSDEERALFAHAVKDVVRTQKTYRILRPASKPILIPTRKKSPLHLRSPVQTESFTLKKVDLSFTSTAQVMPQDMLSFARNGISSVRLKQLRMGKIPYESSLDLHGYTRIYALPALEAFLIHAMKARYRCIRVVHGKSEGIPVIKNAVNQALRAYQEVLAFCSATPKHGGVGAVYVLLKHLPTTPSL